MFKRNILLFVWLILLFLFWNTVYGIDAINENCKTSSHAQYYSPNANICWYFTFYVWDVYDLPDYWVGINWLERVIQASKSTVSVNSLNWYSVSYRKKSQWKNWFSSNWISATADSSSYRWLRPVIWWVYWFRINNTSKNFNANMPVWRIDRNIASYVVSRNWVRVPLSSFKYCTITERNQNWRTVYSRCNYVTSNETVKRINTSARNTHLESYLIFPAWCWDWKIQSSHEQCDNWNSNWDWTWTPTAVNWVVCNTSCQIVHPSCWIATWTYSSSDSEFRWWNLQKDKVLNWQFCSNYSSLDGWVPAFPSKWNSVSWICKLWNETVNCSASRSWWGWGGWWGWWGWGWWGWGWWGWGWWGWCHGWTCTVGECWNFDWKTFDPTSSYDLPKLLKFENPQASDEDFCRWDNWDTILSYNPSIYSKEFKRYCWMKECHAYLKYSNNWLIKIYWSYTWNTLCPECEDFKWADKDIWTNKLFYSDFDKNYTRSIMSWDYLPFGWILPKYDIKYSSICNQSSVWKYNKANLKVKFEFYRWDNNKLVWTSPNYLWFNWIKLNAFKDLSINWQWHMPSNMTKLFNLWINKVVWYIVYRQECESYKIPQYNSSWVLIWYDTWYRWKLPESTKIPFASQTFAVTDTYLIQKNPLSAWENTNISFDGKNIVSWLHDAWVSIPSIVMNYDTWALSKVLSWFIKKYSTYANLCWVNLKWDLTIDYCKIPFEEVYYTSWKNIVFPEWLTFTQPTTIIVENWNVTVRPNIRWSFMLVVKNGKIRIENQNMNTKAILDWYYITDKWFEVTWPARSNQDILNRNHLNSYWYSDWRLEVNGALIGSWAENIFSRRRSFLVWRFDSSKWQAYAVSNWASLTINANPSLWTNAPVWSKDLFEMLKISKWY